MNISVVGWYDRKNIGDDAFKDAFKNIFEGQNLKFFCNEYKSYEEKQDLIVLGGGDVVHPFYIDAIKGKSLNNENGIDRCCPKYAIGVGVAYDSSIPLLDYFDRVYLRNAEDLEKAKSSLGNKVAYIPDLAFLLKPSGNKILHKYKRFPEKPTLGVFITDYIYPAIDRQYKPQADVFLRNLATELDKWEIKGWEVLLIPFSTGLVGDDRRVNISIASYMRHPAGESNSMYIMDSLTPQEMLDLVADLNLAVCMKLHSHIFCMIAGVPFVSVQLTRKVKMLLGSNNLAELVCPFSLDTEFDAVDMTSKLHTISAKKEYYRTCFKTITEKNYNDLLLFKSTIRQELGL